jgi:CSLREA domain-containing protein
MLKKRRRCLAAAPRTRFTYLLLRAMLLGALALAAPAPTVRGATFTVTKLADTNDGACNSDCSLREAIVAANASPGSDIISLPAGTYTLTINGPDDAAAMGDLDIAGDLTISGASASSTIVDGGGLDRVFEIVGGKVTLANLTIRNGDPGFDGSGGGVANRTGASLVVANSIITGNTATFGAGIRSAGALTVTNSLISGNSSTIDGGGISNVSGGALALIASTVGGNETAGQGGGIYSTSVANIISSAVISNTATGTNTGAGGGIYTSGVGTTNNVVLAVTNSTISGNSATIDGGGIYNILGSVYLNNATVANNRADSDADGTGDGGGIMRIPDSGQVFLKNTLLAGNLDAGGQAPDCATKKGNQTAQLSSQGYNLIQHVAGCNVGGTTTGNITGQDAKIGALRNNGGPTPTHALLPVSPALDSADPAGCADQLGRPLTTDQRGFPRPQGGRCDIGAYEERVEAPVHHSYLPIVRR